ncbi:MAG: hypothetical protein AB7P16_24975 [Bradyrhizobium sp.]|uniref:hypothetical protein n=1 Tax=Bradyrhizobium sp. TaxID=376 RepID=UPI003D0DAAA0
MFTLYIDDLWSQGARSFADLTQEQVAHAISLWCRSRPCDASLAVTTDCHVQDRVASRLADYFHAIASQDIKQAMACERGLSALLTNAARQDVERYIEKTFSVNGYLERFALSHGATA